MHLYEDFEKTPNASQGADGAKVCFGEKLAAQNNCQLPWPTTLALKSVAIACKNQEKLIENLNSW